jgi:hypothetical protein
LRRRLATAVLVASFLTGCGSGTTGAFSAEDATMCRELGGGLVYIRYEGADGTEQVRVQPGLDHEQAQYSRGLSQPALRVLELRGWDDEALMELHEAETLFPETIARLGSMPSCLDTLKGNSDATSGSSP